jgi:hypothetical protein
MSGRSPGTGAGRAGEDAIRSLRREIREMPVEDRATLARQLVCDLAVTMDRELVAGLLDELWQEAERVQDVPPSRLRDTPATGADERNRTRDGVAVSARDVSDPIGHRDAGRKVREDDRADDLRGGSGVGHDGRGEFRSGRLL